MYQIDDPSAAAARPAPGAAGAAGWFTDGDPAIALEATVVPADWLNAVQAELLGLLTAGGIAPDKTAINQVLLSIGRLKQKGYATYIADTGAANAYVLTPTPTLDAYAAGVEFTFLAAHTNTGAATVNVAALGAKAIVRADGAALVGGEILAGMLATVRYDGTSFQLAPANARNGFSNLQVFTAGGNFTVPAGVTKVRVTVIGGGGGAGGTGGSTGQGAGGGGAGGAAEKLCAVTPAQVVAVTVGAGGTAGTGVANGGNGGSSSFGAFCSATGGSGGQIATTGTSFGGQGGSGSGGDINIAGGCGVDGQNSSPNGLGGPGGVGLLGGAGRAGTSNSAVLNGQAYGAGAGAAYSAANINGGAGAAGVVIVEW